MGSVRIATVGIAVLGLAACDPAPSDVREWTPADHDGAQTASQARAAGQVASAAAPAGSGADPGLVELAWQRNCARCHGARGRGDGPESAMVKASDLTRPELLDKVTDAELREVIVKGRNKMPAFSLPAPVVDGLVARIRRMGKSGGGAPTPHP